MTIFTRHASLDRKVSIKLRKSFGSALTGGLLSPSTLSLLLLLSPKADNVSQNSEG